MALVVKNLLASAGDIRDVSSIPGSGRSPGEGDGNSLQYSCLENPMDWGAWWATVHGVANSQTRLKWLSIFTHAEEFKQERLEMCSYEMNLATVSLMKEDCCTCESKGKTREWTGRDVGRGGQRSEASDRRWRPVAFFTANGHLSLASLCWPAWRQAQSRAAL